MRVHRHRHGLLLLLLVVISLVMSACSTGAAIPTATTPPQPMAAAAAQPTAKPAEPTKAPATATAAPATPTAVPATPTTPPKPARPEVILATTTSTRDTGLLDVLIPDFQKKTGYTVKPIAVGTGAALAMGERGEADVLLVHAPASEKELMAAGHGASRSLVMHNDFAFVGPKDDPAGIKGTAKAADALKKIAEKQSLFISRGDDSGTDKMEKSLWKTAGVEPGGSWYQESGQGMG
ncbi:MAG: ABC transporter substrate-binding protein, partial [Chloroflexota bacterium]